MNFRTFHLTALKIPTHPQSFKVAESFTKEVFFLWCGLRDKIMKMWNEISIT